MLLTRRNLFKLGAGTLMVASAPFVAARPARAAAPFVQPPLPFPDTALAPTIGSQTVQLHYGRHHAGYFTALNRLVEGTEFAAMTLEEVVQRSAGQPPHQRIFNMAGQAWNHNLYWMQMVPGGSRQPSGALAEKIDRDFGGFDAFKTRFVEIAAGIFGSGWAWLVLDNGALSIQPTSNADNPLAHGKVALMGIDVWEHAYYLDYQNRRGDHVKAVLDNLIDWDYVRDRMPG